jgi:hypothetical protein
MAVQDDFRSAFLARTISWSYLTEAQANALADYALAQAGHESAGFTSPVWLHDTNCIGYKYSVLSQWQSGQGTEGIYGAYSSVGNCANELADWVHRRSSDFDDLGSLDDYVAALQADGYFDDTIGNYLSGCYNYYVPTDLSSFSTAAPSTVGQITAMVSNNLGNPSYWLVGIAIIGVIWAFGGLKKLAKFVSF